VNAVLFDLDGTLLDRDSSIEAFASEQHSRFAALQHVTKEQYVARFIALDCHGSVWKDLVYQTLVREFRISDLGWPDLLIDYESMFNRYCTPFPGLISTLASLQGSGHALGIVTNGRTTFQRGVVKALDIEKFLGVTVVSEAEGVRKPEPEIFHRALRRLGVGAEDSVFVGDNPEADIDGAKRAGMKAVWKRNSGWPASENADATIDSLADLIEIVPALTLPNKVIQRIAHKCAPAE
jgi:putative hydrolase of the HAD superfamily